MEEIWKDIEGYEGYYQVSNLGRVRSLDNYEKFGKVTWKRKGKILKPRLNEKGYALVNLSINSKTKNHRVHRLVWEAFNGPIPEGFEINHINENKEDNRLENINLMTHKNNINWGTGIRRQARKKRMPVTQILQDGTEFFSYFSVSEAEKETGINNKSIRLCCNGKIKTAGGFKWRYAE